MDSYDDRLTARSLKPGRGQEASILGLRPLRACLVPLDARSSTSVALTSSTTWPRRASAYLIVTVAAFLSSMGLPVRSEMKMVFRAKVFAPFSGGSSRNSSGGGSAGRLGCRAALGAVKASHLAD